MTNTNIKLPVFSLASRQTILVTPQHALLTRTVLTSPVTVISYFTKPELLSVPLTRSTALRAYRILVQDDNRDDPSGRLRAICPKPSKIGNRKSEIRHARGAHQPPPESGRALRSDVSVRRDSDENGVEDEARPEPDLGIRNANGRGRMESRRKKEKHGDEVVFFHLSRAPDTWLSGSGRRAPTTKSAKVWFAVKFFFGR